MKKRDINSDKPIKSFDRGIVTLIVLIILLQIGIFIVKSITAWDESPVENVTVYGLPDGEQFSTSDVADVKVDNSSVEELAENDHEDRSRSVSQNGNVVSGSGGNYKRNTYRKDSVYLDINLADSSDLLRLRGIGPYYTSKILQYRKRLGGFANTLQLMEIWGVDSIRYEMFCRQIFVDKATIVLPDLYTMTQEELANHPYIGKYASWGVIRARENLSREEFSIKMLVEQGVLDVEKWRYYL